MSARTCRGVVAERLLDGVEIEVGVVDEALARVVERHQIQREALEELTVDSTPAASSVRTSRISRSERDLPFDAGDDESMGDEVVGRLSRRSSMTSAGGSVESSRCLPWTP